MDISSVNFHSYISKIKSDIKMSSFIAVDTEFTGLFTSNAHKKSYFDSGNSVYEKELNNLQDVSICQIGISIFKGLIDENAYSVSTYNFFIRPHSLLCVDENIKCQVSSLEFLNQNGFDFKKWLVDGIPCLHEEQEGKVRKFYSEVLSGDSAGLTPYEVLASLETVKKWLSEAKIGDSLDIPLDTDTNVLLFFSYVLSLDLNVLPFYQNNKLFVEKKESVSKEEIKEKAENAIDEIVGRLKGFVNVFQCLVEAKVPLVVHNGMLDLLLIYKQFYRSLPKQLQEFKSSLHEMFPLIYDSKQLAFILSSKLKSQEANVGDLVDRFLCGTSLKGVKNDLETVKVVLHRPAFRHSPDTPKYSDGVAHYHEAGYDAFCTGYCFLQLSHIYSMYNCKKISEQRPLSPREHTHSMKQWANVLPVQHAGIRYISLDGHCPDVQKLTWLVIEPRNPLKTLNTDLVAESLRNFGLLDIVRRTKRSAMIATPRHAVSMKRNSYNVYFRDTTN